MSIWGKLLGVGAGLALGGPIGAILGGVAGHIYDQWRKENRGTKALPPHEDVAADFQDPLETKRVAFATAVIVLAAKLAKADGVVSKVEIQAFKSQFGLGDTDVGDVAAIFNEAKRDARGFEPFAQQVADLFAYEPAVLEELLDGLFAVAAADGELHQAELVFLARVAAIFGFGQLQFDAIAARYIASRSYSRGPRGRSGDGGHRQRTAAQPQRPDPHLVLGLDRRADEATVKKRYRELVREHHPDRLMAKGVPEEFVRQANDKLAAINAAYDEIARQRGFS